MNSNDVNYTNIRDKIMDKYWLDFLASIEGDCSVWKTEYGAFWYWFYNSKMNRVGKDSLEQYL